MILSENLERIKEQLKELKETGAAANGIFITIRYDEELKKEIFSLTSFLDSIYTNIELGQRLYHIRENIDDILYCDVCGKPKKFYRYSNGYFPTCGDKNCKNNKRIDSFKSTIEEKYQGNYFGEGSAAREKYKNTMQEKYGVDHNFKSKELREKAGETMFERYGVKHALANKDIQEKRKQTCLENNGTLNFLHNEKSKKTNIEKYGYDNHMKNKEQANKVAEACSATKQNQLKEKLKLFDITLVKYDNIRSQLMCEKCGTIFTNHPVTTNSKLRLNMDPCPKCNPPDLTASLAEKELANFISSVYEGEIKTNYRGVFKDSKTFSEVGIYLPDLNIAFEYNGLYWHSELYKDPSYHQDKSNYLLSKGIKLYHIWEDDWVYKKDIVKSMILSILGKNQNKIFARKCNIKRVEYNEYMKFCEINHLKSYAPANTILGLYYNEELVSLASFGKTRKLIDSKKSEYEYELIRSCTKLNNIVIGGTSRLLKYFKDNISISLVTYCDISFSPDKNNTVYDKIGMKFIKSTSPGYYWVIDRKRSNRLNWTKDKLISAGYDKTKTADSIMRELGAYKIWDCGNYKFSTI